jgi:hypothetical protein
LVSQAVTKSLPLVIAQRVDDVIDRGRGGWQSYQLFRREHRKSYGQVLMGLSSLFVIIWILMLGHGSISFASGFLLVMTIALILTSVHDIWIKRQRAGQSQKQEELPSSYSTKELTASHDVPGVSVTDSTTRELKVQARQHAREDELT